MGHDGSLLTALPLVLGYAGKQLSRVSRRDAHLGYQHAIDRAACALVGAAAGAVNGVLVSKVRIPPILATLGAGELFSGISIVITNGKAVSKLPIVYAQSINNRLGGLVPVQLIIFTAMALLIWFLLSRTSYGTKIYMLGTNAKAAEYSGLKVDRLLIKTYMLSGVCAALGGLIMLANYNSARADYGTVYTLQCVLIVILGGVNPVGGKGRISGVVFAICLLRVLETGINRFPQISSYYITLIWGGVLILVMTLDFFTERNTFALARSNLKESTA